MTAQELAAKYLDLGWVPVPVPFRRKCPGTGWNTRTLEGARDSLNRDFGVGPQNIGVLLGAPSHGLADIDMDCAEALGLAPEFLPPTRTFGRDKNPASHWIYTCPNVESAKYPEPRPRGVTPAMLVELRSTGCQTVFPGSVHESGEAIEWTDESIPVATIEAADLYKRVAQLAAACHLVRQGMGRAEAIEHARTNGEFLINHPCTATVRKWLTGKTDRTKPAKKAADRHAAKIDAAVEAFNRANPGSWPKSGGPCPACQHEDCFGTMPDNPARWVCFSASHTAPGIAGNNCHHGDALDLAAFETGRSRVQMLVAAGFLPLEEAPPGEQDPEFITDLGIANRFVKRHGTNARYVRALKSWFIWDGERWVRDDTGKATHLCAQVARDVTIETAAKDEKIHKAARQQEQRSRIAGALDLAGVNPIVATRVEQLDADPWLLTCSNGTIELKTGLLRRHERGDLITKLVPHTFDPDATCPRWERFLSEVMNGRGNLVDFLQRWAGYCLTAEIREHAILLLVGNGCNGKSVSVEVLMDVLGPEFATPAPPGLLLVQKGERHPTEIMDLRSRRLVVANEVPRNATFNEERVKALAGGDTLKGRGMRQDFVAFPPTHKLVACANHMPRVRDSSDAFFRRLRVVPFDVSFKGREDKTLVATLRAEATGILAWMVRGCLAWQKEGLGDPIEITRATNSYRESEDLIGQFLADRDASAAPTIDVAARQLYTDYKDWCEANGDKPASNKFFGEELERLGWVRRHTKTRNVWSAPLPAPATPPPPTAPTQPPLAGEGMKAGEGSSGLNALARACAREETNQPERSSAFTLHPDPPAVAPDGQDWEEVVL